MRTALLIIDMQKFFSDMVSPRMMENITTLVGHFRRERTASDRRPLIVFTQHGHTEEELSTHPSPNQLVRKWGLEGSIRAGSRDWEFMPRIRELVNVNENAKVIPSLNGIAGGQEEKEKVGTETTVIIPKTTYDAFIHTRLEDVLRGKEIQRVVVCGVMTDCCVDTTARGAFNRGFETWVVEDACGSANERQHRRGLEGFRYAFGEVLSTKEVLGRLEEEGI